MTITNISLERQLRYTTEKLGQYLAQERRRYQQSVMAYTSYSKASHQVLKALVPAYKALNAWHQTEGESRRFASAPMRFAKALVEHFIVPFEPAMWRMPLDPFCGSDLALRARVRFEHPAEGESCDIHKVHIPPGFLKTVFSPTDTEANAWLAGQVMYDEHCVWAIRNLEGSTIGELRLAYEEYRRDIAKTRKARVAEVLVKVKGMLSEEEYALLQSTLLVV